MAQNLEQRRVALDNLDAVEPYGETAMGQMLSSAANMSASISGTMGSMMTNFAEQDAVEAAAAYEFEFDEAGNPVYPEIRHGFGGLAARQTVEAGLDERYKDSHATNLQNQLTDAHDRNLYNEEAYRQEAAVIIGASGDVLDERFAGWFGDTSMKLNSELAAKIGYRSATRAEAEARAAARANARQGAERANLAEVSAERDAVIAGWRAGDNPEVYFDDNGNLRPDAAITADTIATNNVRRGVSSVASGTPNAAATTAESMGLNDEAVAQVGVDRSAQLSAITSSTFVPYLTSKGKFSADGRNNAKASLSVRQDDSGFAWAGITQSRMDDVLSITDNSAMVHPDYYRDGFALNPPNDVAKTVMERQYGTGHLTPGLSMSLSQLGAGALSDPMQAQNIAAVHTRLMESADVPGGWIAENEDLNGRIMATKAFLRLHSPGAVGFEEEWAEHLKGQRKKDLTTDEIKEATSADTKAGAHAKFKSEAESVLRSAGLDPTLSVAPYANLLRGMVRNGMTLNEAKDELKSDLVENGVQDGFGRSRADDFIAADGSDIGFVWKNDDWARFSAPYINGAGADYMERAARMAISEATGQDMDGRMVRMQVNKDAQGRITYTPWYMDGVIFSDWRSSELTLDFNAATQPLGELHTSIPADQDGNALVALDRKIIELQDERDALGTIRRGDTEGVAKLELIEQDIRDLHEQRDNGLQVKIDALSEEADRILMETVVKGAFE